VSRISGGGMWIWALVIILGLGMLVFAACAPDEEAADPDREGGVVSIAVGGDPHSLDYHLQSDWVSRQALQPMFEPLLYYDEEEELQGMLAVDWDHDEDGMTYTFELREGVTFHDGTEFNAEAVKHNFDRILDPDADTRHYDTFEPYLEDVEVIDELTVQFNLKEPWADFLGQMTWSSHIQSPTAIEEKGDAYAESPVGTGPFKFDEFEPDSHIKYTRFDDHWDGPPHLDGVEVRIIPEASTRVIELEAGTLDMAYGVEAKDVARLEDAGVVVEERSTATYQTVYKNLAKAPTDDPDVRKAIARAIDRDIIIEQVLDGAALKSRAGVPDLSPFYSDNVPMVEYDPAEAESILEDAGWTMEDGVRTRDGEELEIIILTSDAEQRVLISEIIQEQLREIGIDAEIHTLEWGAYLDAMLAGDYNISYWSLATYAHELGTGTMNLRSDAYWNVSHITDNPDLAEVSGRIDEIIEDVAVTVDTDERAAMLEEFQMMVYDYQLFTPMWHVLSHNPVQPWVQGYELYNYNIFWMRDAWVEED